MLFVALAELAAASHETPVLQHNDPSGWPLIHSIILICSLLFRVRKSRLPSCSHNFSSKLIRLAEKTVSLNEKFWRLRYCLASGWLASYRSALLGYQLMWISVSLFLDVSFTSWSWKHFLMIILIYFHSTFFFSSEIIFSSEEKF